MATGTSYDGKSINVADRVSILGAVVSITGSAPSTAAVVIAEIYGLADNFTCHANDLTTRQNTSGAGMSMNGKLFTTGDRATANGTVTAVSGSGQGAQLTVLLDNSGLSINCSAGSCRGNSAN